MNYLSEFMNIPGMESLNPLIKLSISGEFLTYDELLKKATPGQICFTTVEKVYENENGRLIVEVI